MNISYQVYFMRKLWFNVIPGRDQEADCIFHYPQVNSVRLPPLFFSFQPHMINLILTWGSYDLRNRSAWWCYSLTDTNSICTQELPKYLRGYHHCTKEEMVQLAALLFRVKVENDKTQLVMITKMLKELVPNDQLKAMSAEDWKKVRNAGIMHVIVSYYTTVLLNAQSW